MTPGVLREEARRHYVVTLQNKFKERRENLKKATEETKDGRVQITKDKERAHFRELPNEIQESDVQNVVQGKLLAMTTRTLQIRKTLD